MTKSNQSSRNPPPQIVITPGEFEHLCSFQQRWNVRNLQIPWAYVGTPTELIPHRKFEYLVGGSPVFQGVRLKIPLVKRKQEKSSTRTPPTWLLGGWRFEPTAPGCHTSHALRSLRRIFCKSVMDFRPSYNGHCCTLDFKLLVTSEQSEGISLLCYLEHAKYSSEVSFRVSACQPGWIVSPVPGRKSLP